MSSPQPPPFAGYHHLTMSTDGAQEDFDFYTKALGLHSVKRTVLYDGAKGIMVPARKRRRSSTISMRRDSHPPIASYADLRTRLKAPTPM